MNNIDREILRELEDAFLRMGVCMEPDSDDGSAVIRLTPQQADAFVKIMESIVVKRVADDNHEGIIRMGLN